MKLRIIKVSEKCYRVQGKAWYGLWTTMRHFISSREEADAIVKELLEYEKADLDPEVVFEIDTRKKGVADK